MRNFVQLCMILLQGARSDVIAKCFATRQIINVLFQVSVYIFCTYMYVAGSCEVYTY